MSNNQNRLAVSSVNNHVKIHQSAIQKHTTFAPAIIQKVTSVRRLDKRIKLIHIVYFRFEIVRCRAC
jgi:hypothetical protein